MQPLTVKQVNEYIAKKLRDDYNLRDLVIIGEISGFSLSGRNAYLTLKDPESQIKCNIWSNYLAQIDMSVLENGSKVIVTGDISPYAKGGYYSFSIRKAEPAGAGEASREFNRIKALLESEGLFDKAHKTPLPLFPKRIAVITSPTGAAIEDIKKIILQKNDYTDILIFPAQVQGNLAVASIIENIRAANEVSRKGKHIDLLIVGRGGGSPEDLAAFNDEGLARAIFASEIPVVSAVGHESDFSISDFVADVRAETPTAAANMAVPDTHEMREVIEYSTETILNSMKTRIEHERHLVAGLTELTLNSSKSKVRELKLTVEKSLISLNENDPRSILKKGYAAVRDRSGNSVYKIEGIETGSEYEILLYDGSFLAEAISKKKGESI